MSAVANPWLHPLRAEPHVLPEDQAAVSRWNAALPTADPRRIELHVLPEHMPSQDFAIALVNRAMDREAAIIIGTASRFWRHNVLGLGSYRHLITKNSPQNKSLSPGNLGDGYAIVSASLNR